MVLMKILLGTVLGLLGAFLLIYLVARKRKGAAEQIDQENINSWFRKRG